ncbi:hypothetical protein [Alteromonas sp. 14N.309.X.WAT.G.H12]|uniref:hypothetical protein n=1 Tax=Alteromonas sp. 14N.309.X.WAT.G.H12 TaxID=3120824 RepID=UPI002FD6F82F
MMTWKSLIWCFVGLYTTLPGVSQAEWLLQDYSNTENLSNETITLVFTGLEEHSYVMLNWNLYLIDTWDGYNEELSYATDYWGFSVDGESYSWSFAAYGSMNSDVDTNPDDSGVKYQSGSSFYESAPVISYTDSIYYYDNYNGGWIFEHDSDTLTITFFAYGLQNIYDESWAIDELYIATATDAETLLSLGNLQDVSEPMSPAALFSFLLFGLWGRRPRLFKQGISVLPQNVGGEDVKNGYNG